MTCNQELFALGGESHVKCLSSVERLSEVKSVWEDVQSMQLPRKWFAAVNCNGIMFAIGEVSSEESASTTETVEKYIFTSGKWNYVCSLNIERRCHAAWVMSGKIYVVGGSGGSWSKI